MMKNKLKIILNIRGSANRGSWKSFPSKPQNLRMYLTSELKKKSLSGNSVCENLTTISFWPRGEEHTLYFLFVMVNTQAVCQLVESRLKNFYRLWHAHFQPEKQDQSFQCWDSIWERGFMSWRGAPPRWKKTICVSYLSPGCGWRNVEARLLVSLPKAASDYMVCCEILILLCCFSCVDSKNHVFCFPISHVVSFHGHRSGAELEWSLNTDLNIKSMVIWKGNLQGFM